MCKISHVFTCVKCVQFVCRLALGVCVQKCGCMKFCTITFEQNVFNVHAGVATGVCFQKCEQKCKVAKILQIRTHALTMQKIIKNVCKYGPPGALFIIEILRK